MLKAGKTNKLYIKTFGCQMNIYDSKKIVDIMNHHFNCDLVDTPDKADIVVFNTCSIRENCESKLYSDLGRLKKQKDNNSDLVVAVGGCIASQEGENILKNNLVDIVFGPQTLHRLPELVIENRKSRKQQIDISFPEMEKFDEIAISDNNGSASAYVSIMEGCSKFCSYCIVPYTRGRELSRKLSDVLKEIQNLASKGVKEVNLLGQNVNGYLGENEDGLETDLAYLLEEVNEIKGIERIRFTTSHPSDMSERLILCFSYLPKLANHLHLPIQSGSDSMLASMKRGYTVLEYKSIIRKLWKASSDISLSSDFIIGFPGETDEDFKRSLDIIDFVKFDKSFSFIYSQRPGTPAAQMNDDVSKETKKYRIINIQELLRKYERHYSELMLGKVYKVLVDSKSKFGDMLTGRSENNKVINFKAPDSYINELVDIRITELKTNTLIGELCT